MAETPCHLEQRTLGNIDQPVNKVAVPLVANVFTADMQTAGIIQTRAIPDVKIPGSLLRMLYEEKSEWKLAGRRTAKVALLCSATINFSDTKKILDEQEELEKEWQN